MNEEFRRGRGGDDRYVTADYSTGRITSLRQIELGERASHEMGAEYVLSRAGKLGALLENRETDGALPHA